jgi:hypothetical protein
LLNLGLCNPNVSSRRSLPGRAGTVPVPPDLSAWCERADGSWCGAIAMPLDPEARPGNRGTSAGSAGGSPHPVPAGEPAALQGPWMPDAPLG